MEQNSSISNFKAFYIPLSIISIYLTLEFIFRIYFFGFYTIFNWNKYNPQGILVTDIVEEVEDPEICWKLKPNLNTIFKTKTFTTNSLGFRNRELELNKPSDKIRIAVLGRSITMGAGVNDYEVYTDVLQNQLDQWKPDSYEIINCAVGAHNIKQMFMYYETYVAKLNPDIILIPLTIKDLIKNVPINPPPLSLAIPKKTNLRYYFSFTFLYDSSRLLMKRKLNKIISTDWKDRYLEANDTKIPTIASKNILSEFIDKRNKEGISCYIMSMIRSEPKNIEDLKNSKKKFIDFVNKQKNVTFLDNYQYIIGNIPKKNTIYFGDNHPSASMHELFSNAVFQNIKEHHTKIQ